ncbi:MAG TPA: Rho termination factor N-terminal domain-containing protein [Solirubrobacteraceae bacterium]|nr:Rho termination factor N-terminal domain-containing protein [Solirubrobacteraceae bacterium]
MSAVLDRGELEKSPLADLHLLANELGVDGFRRLRKEELIDAILGRQEAAPADEAAPPEETAPLEEAAPAEEEESREEDEGERRPRRGRRGGRGRGRARAEEGSTDEDAGEPEPREEPRGGDRTAEGVVELLANGSGFIRLDPPEPTDDDVYISAAQVKRCELVSGDRIGGPVRAARRSERFPSLIRVDTINGRPADEVAEGTRFDDLPAAFPAERFELNSDDPTLKAIEWLTPFGKGSRVVVAGGPRSGKSEALRRLAGALAGREGLEVSLVLAGVRPEETREWPLEPVAALSFGASADAQAQAVEQAIEQGRRVAARGGDAVVLVDTLEALPVAAARRALAAARNISDGGSLTVIATAAAPLGGETTVVALDAGLTALGRFPALDLEGSGVLRPDLLVGDAGAEAIAKARADALAG